MNDYLDFNDLDLITPVSFRETRKEMGYTQEALAQQLGLGKRGQATISDIERAKKPLSNRLKTQLQTLYIVYKMKDMERVNTMLNNF